MLVKHHIFEKLHVELEQQEARYFSDYFHAAGTGVVRALGLQHRSFGTACASVASSIDILAFNRVIGIGIGESASPAQIDELIALYRDAGVPRFFVQLSPHAQPAQIPDWLLARGFHAYNNWVKWLRPIAPLPQGETDLRIEQIDGSEAETFARIIIESFEWPQALAPLVAGTVGRSDWLHYLAYDGDQPAACAAQYIRSNFGSLAFAATLPDFRGRGAQSALIARRFRDAATAGCRWMVTETAQQTLQRRVASYRNMQRHGFRIAYLRPSFLYTFD